MVASSHVVQDESCCFYDEATLILYLSTLYLYVTIINTWEIVLEGFPHEDLSEHLVKKYHTECLHITIVEDPPALSTSSPHVQMG